MKKLVFLSFLLVLGFSSCLQIDGGGLVEEEVVVPDCVYPALEGLYAVISVADDDLASGQAGEVAFVEGDIASLNITTRELRFRQRTFQELYAFIPARRSVSRLTFYLDWDSLFSAFSISSMSSFIENDLVFHMDLSAEKIYLIDGYPVWNDNFGESTSAILAARDSLAQARKPAWDRFIQYLDEKGLLTEGEEPVVEEVIPPPPAPRDSISTKP
jgi:hypothetical protein